MAWTPRSKNVTYRIQNVGYASFLELTNVDEDEPVYLRPLKDELKQQARRSHLCHVRLLNLFLQWKFVEDGSDDPKFKIINAADGNLGLIQDEKLGITCQPTRQSGWSVQVVDGARGVYV